MDTLSQVGTTGDGVVCFNGVEISKLSKRQTKKYKKFLEWQEIKKNKRLQERIKNKEKRTQAKLNNKDIGPSRKELKRSRMADSPCKISVCIDLSFDDLMIDKDMARTVKQILRVYTLNRRAKASLQLHLSDFTGRVQEAMSRHHGFEHWDLHFHPENYLQIFSKESLVYLTSESPNVIHHLEEDKVYVIGGLVDHNYHKGLCYKKAVSQGIAHAQLPIQEYFQMKLRKVLTINHVFEVLLKVSEGRSFKEALECVIPKRADVRPLIASNTTTEDCAENISSSNNSNGDDQTQECSSSDSTVDCTENVTSLENTNGDDQSQGCSSNHMDETGHS